MLKSGFYLSRVLSEFRRNVVQLQRAVDVRFFLAANASLVPSQLIFIELKSEFLGPPSQSYVVFLTPGEVIQGERELLIGHYAQIRVDDQPPAFLNPLVNDNAGLGLPLADDLANAGHSHEVVH